MTTRVEIRGSRRRSSTGVSWTSDVRTWRAHAGRCGAMGRDKLRFAGYSRRAAGRRVRPGRLAIDRAPRSSIGGLEPSYHQVGRKKRRARPGGPLVYDEQQDGDVPLLHRGEADTVRPRVDSHGQRLAFWERAIVLTAGSPLNKAHVKGREATVIARAKDAGRCAVTHPRGIQPTPPEGVRSSGSGRPPGRSAGHFARGRVPHL